MSLFPEQDEAITKFDVRRLTIIGWLLFLGAAVFAFACLGVTWTFYAQIFAPTIRPDGSFDMYPMIPFIAFAVGGLGSFFAGKVLFQLLGVEVVGRKENDFTTKPPPRKKSSKSKRRREVEDEDDD